MKSYQCFKCQKEITSGKFYSFFAGEKGKKTLIKYNKSEEDACFCPTCADQEKANPTGFWTSEQLIKVEWEAGNQTDEGIIEFEKKWQELFLNCSKRINNKQTNLTLDFVQNARQEFEPYLQKPEIAEKSFGGKIKGYGVVELWINYLFDKSARDEKYRKEVVGPTFAEILGGEDPNQEINTIHVGGSSIGGVGITEGVWKIDENINIPYIWNDGEEKGQIGCRRIRFGFRDHRLALQALCRSLKIKEKELGGEDNSPKKPNQPNSKTCANCGRGISNQEFTYTSESSSEKKKTFCSQKCLEESKNKPQNENNPKKKGMSTSLKVFLGISAAVLVLIIIIIGIWGIEYKRTSKRERERERETKVIYAQK